MLLINFDENDGYFDHVPPAAPSLDTADGTARRRQRRAGRRVDGQYRSGSSHPALAAGPADHRVYGGPRVPMYVVSPWSRGGWVNSRSP